MKRPQVGVGVFIKKDGKILVGKRKGSHGAGTWALPGGHLEPGESFDACCKREVLEETGLIIKNVSPVVFTNDIFHDEGRHYITLFFKGEYESASLSSSRENTNPERQLLQSHANVRSGGGFH
jgi:8-oxo-dGTP diphosphatase